MPARLPRHQKELTGTLRRDREAAEPAVPQQGRARAPSWLSATERRAFQQLAVEVERTGVATRSFTHVLAAAAVAADQLIRCTKALSENGDTYETETTTGALKIVARPEVALRNTSLRLLKGYLSELGITPVAIGRVDRAVLPKDGPPNAFGKLALVKQKRR